MNSLRYQNGIYDIELKVISTTQINVYRNSPIIETIESYDPIRGLNRFEATYGYLLELAMLLRTMGVFYSYN